MDNAVEHRRKFPRIPSQITVLVRKMGDNEVEGFVKTKVVGLGGCMFMSDEKLGEETYLELLISVKRSVAKAVGRVAYELDAQEGVEVGVEFMHISDSDRLLLETLWDGSTAH